MKNRIIEICELGKPQSIIHRENEPITELIKTTDLVEELNKQLILSGVVSSLTSKDKLYLNTLLVNKLLEKEDDGTYKAANDIGLMDKINDLMGKVNNS
jgi:hypothetical protein